MAVYKRKGTRNYWYRFEHNGKEYRGSTHETAKRAAEEAERRERVRIESTPEGGSDVPREKHHNLKELEELDIARAYAEGLSKLTIRSMRAVHWRHLRRELGDDRDIATINARTIDQYVGARRAQKIRGQTIRKELATLKRGLTRACRDGWIRAVPPDWPRIKSDPPHAQYAGKIHTDDILQKVLEELPDTVKDMVRFAMLTGLRSSELLRVRWQWIKETNDPAVPAHLHMPADATKTRNERVIGLLPQAYEIAQRHVVRRHAQGTLFGGNNVDQYLRRACREIQYRQNVTLRDLRHRYATVAFEYSRDLKATMAVLGHKTLWAAGRYQHTSERRAHKVAKTAGDALAGTVPTKLLPTNKTDKSEKPN